MGVISDSLNDRPRETSPANSRRSTFLNEYDTSKFDVSGKDVVVLLSALSSLSNIINQ